VSECAFANDTTRPLAADDTVVLDDGERRYNPCKPSDSKRECRRRKGRHSWQEVFKDEILTAQWEEHDMASLFRIKFLSQSPRNAIPRLAYANGKLYFLNSPSKPVGDDQNKQSVTLQEADVTLAVDCGSVMPAFKQSFANWAIDETKFGIPEDATPGHAETVYLSEGAAARMPWVFKAYRKVIQVNNKLVIKKTVCARPKPPTTRPSLESCCVEKQTIPLTDNAANECTDQCAPGMCKMKTVMKLF